ncbi:DUF1501 domain-containing protein [Flavobacterium piscinae]|uniref:DUF1501 domain-containing protein n=1 Tax=Flavobacterium piscinae TaxID=2506424 RepID=A0A4Q1KV27_9FLAO|nr:DUF1501 domain-containing protein [Flavobacterium piscinae]RXR33014.1 DUF1501 domain-containing protein [Flavobacterium piscinae]
MERRKFIQLTATGTGGLLLLPNFLSAQSLWTADTNLLTDEVVVFIQLNGGNDGLNTFIPFDDPLYYDNRPTIGIGKQQIINAINGMGFHPALKDLATISQEGNLSVIQNVGYPEPNRSHFRSIEIWQTASDSHQYLDNGWLGRFLDIQCKDETVAALNVDSIDNLALKSTLMHSVTVKDFNKIKNYGLEERELTLSDNPQLDFVRKLQFASLEGMEEIQKALKNGKAVEETYSNNELAKNLQWIGKLIKGNLSSKVYYTALNGFDTHKNQTNVHQKQLTILNDAVYSFYKDMKKHNLLPRVTVVVFSEFGRRVKENGTGTDHGTAGPMLVIGGKNKGKIIGNNPNLATLDKGDLVHEIDFRSVYAALLQNKFNFDASAIGIKNAPLGGLF